MVGRGIKRSAQKGIWELLNKKHLLKNSIFDLQILVWKLKIKDKEIKLLK